jgi:hypothetical protein
MFSTRAFYSILGISLDGGEIQTLPQPISGSGKSPWSQPSPVKQLFLSQENIIIKPLTGKVP